MTSNELRVKLGHYIKERGMKQKEVAIALEVTISMVSHFLAGRKKFSKQNVVKLIELMKQNY